jgi:hypothetical protein
MKKYLISIVVFIFLLPVYVLAGEYVLIKGQNREGCKAYQKNLNSFNLHNEYVMACQRKLSPQFTDFQKPEWQKMDLRKNIELLKKIELFLGNWGVVTPDNVKGWEEYIESRIKEEYASIDLCQIDINNDGKKENVIKYNDGSCPQGHYGAALLVLNDDRTEIDIQKTKPLLQNPRSLKNGPPSEGWDGTTYDIFIYKKKAYFDRWRYGDLSSDGKTIIDTYDLLRVYLAEPDKKGNSITREICRYKFR